MTWNDIPAAAKMSAAVVVAVLSVLGYLTTYQTDAEAQAYQQQHQSELVRFRIQQIEQQISAVRFQLISDELTPQQREWLLQELKRLEDMKKCILDGKC